jgi:transmembrane sensor
MTEHDDTPPDTTAPWTLLARYLAGNCDVSEEATVAQWIAADAANARLLDELRATWAITGGAPRRPDVEAILRRSKRGRPDLRLAADLPPPVPMPAARRPIRVTPAGTPMAVVRRGWMMAVAAAAAAGLVVWTWRSVPLLSRQAAVPQRELATDARQQLTVRFDDGTRVQMAPGSRLHYADPAATGQTPRDVTLDGEAVFDVVHDAAHPFTVRAGPLITRDVGTRFVVRAYPTDERREVTVADGSVTVTLGAESGSPTIPPLLIHQAERARADSAGRLARDIDVDTATALAWTAGRLVFVSTPMREVVPELARWYGIDVRLGDSALAERRLSASFTREPVASVLMSVAAAVDARAERTDDGRTTVFRSAP